MTESIALLKCIQESLNSLFIEIFNKILFSKLVQSSLSFHKTQNIHSVQWSIENHDCESPHCAFHKITTTLHQHRDSLFSISFLFQILHFYCSHSNEYTWFDIVTSPWFDPKHYYSIPWDKSAMLCLFSGLLQWIVFKLLSTITANSIVTRWMSTNQSKEQTEIVDDIFVTNACIKVCTL